MIGMAAADARLKQEVEVIRLRDCKELRALLCHKLFIGGHNALAVFQTRLHKVIRRVRPPITSTTICTSGVLK